MGLYQRFLFVCFFFFLAHGSFAQKQGNVWTFGASAGVDFNPPVPVGFLGSAMQTNEACASISDASGRLLFYTNGVQVWDSTHSLMPNGSGLLGTETTTQCLIAPVPLQDSLYYIFYSSSVKGSGLGAFQYAIVNMNLNGGAGDVAVKNQVLFSPVAEKVCATRHANGVDLWIICHEWNFNTFRAYLLTCEGLSNQVVLSSAGTPHAGSANMKGYMKVSHNGNRLAALIPAYGLAEVFEFNPATGEVLPNPIAIENLNFPYGIEFSPNDSVLYVSQRFFQSGTIGEVWQFDLSSNDSTAISNSRYLVQSSLNFNVIYAIQLGPDGKIYACQAASLNLAEIASPNSLGAACGFSSSGVFLQGRLANSGLPPGVGFLRPTQTSFSSNGICTVNPVSFVDESDYTPDSTMWFFGDPGSGQQDTSTLANPSHVYANPGTYTVTMINFHSCAIDTAVLQITIEELAVDLGQDTVLCAGSTISLDAGNPGATYNWSTGQTGQAIGVDSAGTYGVVVSNNGCIGSDSIVITLAPNLLVEIGPDTSICPGDSFLLDAGNPGASYQWFSGDTTQVVSVSQPGTYGVNVDQNGCLGSDSMVLSNVVPLFLDLGRDTVLCGDSLVLQGGFADNYQWSTGETTPNIMVIDTGLVFLTISNSCQSIQDSIHIGIGALPQVSLPDNIRLCGRESLTLSAGNNGEMTSWQFLNNGGTWIELDTTTDLVIRDPGEFQVVVHNACGNTTEAFSVEINPDSGHFIPNVFTPNNDQINDFFRLEVDNPDGFFLEIYDRWGKEVFQTEDPQNWWGGMLGGKELSEGTYYYVVRLRTCFGELVEKKGPVTLLR